MMYPLVLPSGTTAYCEVHPVEIVRMAASLKGFVEVDMEPTGIGDGWSVQLRGGRHTLPTMKGKNVWDLCEKVVRALNELV